MDTSWTAIAQMFALIGFGAAWSYVQHRWSERSRVTADTTFKQLNDRMLRLFTELSDQLADLHNRTMTMTEKQQDYAAERTFHVEQPDPNPGMPPPKGGNEETQDVADFERQLSQQIRRSEARRRAQDDGRELVEPQDI